MQILITLSTLVSRRPYTKKLIGFSIQGGFSIGVGEFSYLLGRFSSVLKLTVKTELNPRKTNSELNTLVLGGHSGPLLGFSRFSNLLRAVDDGEGLLVVVVVVVVMVVVVVVTGRVDRSHGAERGSLGRGGTGLVRPGVAGEPLGRDEILTGGVGRVNIAPLGSSTVHSQTVALHHSVSVPEGEAAALTPTVYQRRGGLGLRVLHLHGAGGGDDGEGAEESEEDDVTAVLHGEDICW